jgi:integrase
VGHDVVAGSPKTDRGLRTVHLDPIVVTALRTWRAKQAAEQLAWCAAYEQSGRVFTREDGRALHPETITKTMQRRLKHIDVPRIRLHDLRHTSATLALDVEEDMRLVMQRLGHSSIAVTVNMYTHAAPEPAKAAASRLALLVTGVGAAVSQ